MKFITAIILTALLGFAAPLYFPWWSFVITSCVVAIAIHQKAWKAFVCGFLGLLLLWVVMAYIIDSSNQHLLSKKIAELLPLNGSYNLLIIITGLIGGLVSGFAALTGSFARGKKHNE